MLKLIEGSCASFFPKEIDAMFRNRAETFSDRLGWEVVVKDGYERDCFDDANPLYLVSVDPDTEQWWGSLRLLPTTGPNMLRDMGKFANLRHDCARSAGSKQERRQLRSERAHIGHRRSRRGGWADANRFRIRRQDFPRPESRRMRSPDHWQAATDRRGHELRRSFRHRPGAAEGVPRRVGNRELGPCSGRERACVRLRLAEALERRAILRALIFRLGARCSRSVVYKSGRLSS
jgi:hypothetical protein